MTQFIILGVLILAMMATICYAIYNMTKITEDVIEERIEKEEQ